MGFRASSVIAAAGVPQLIYTVPAGKIAAASLQLVNAVGASATIEAKRGSGIAAPGSLAFSRAVQVAGLFTNTPYLQSGSFISLSSTFDVLSGVPRVFSGTTPGRLDLTDQLVPVFTAVSWGSEIWPRDERFWNTTAANRFWTGVSTLTRYLDSTSSPFSKGATVRTLTSVQHGVGYGDQAIGCGSASVSGQYWWHSAVPTSAGTANLNTGTSVTATFTGVSDTDYRDVTKSGFFYANGVWFFVNITTGNGFINVWSTSTPQTAGSWKQHTQWTTPAVLSTSIDNIRLVHHSGFFWILFESSSSNINVIRTPDSLAATNPVWTRVGNFASAAGLVSNGDRLFRANGRWWAGSNGFIDLTQTALPLVRSTVHETVGTPLGPQNLLNARKVTPVDLNAHNNFMFAVPTTGATDTTNDLTVYGTSGIYRFVTDPQWGLRGVGNDGQLFGPPATVNNNASLSYTGRVLEAGDQVWVQSSLAGIGVSVEGFLRDA